MEQIQLGDQVIRFDRERTRQAYSSMKGGDAERSGCSYCRNFAAQRSTAYPEVFRSLLDQLGIDPEKEGEVYESGPEGSLRMYGGCSKLQPCPDRRSFYSYLARLWKQGLLERVSNPRRGRLSYRITNRGQARIAYLRAQSPRAI